MSHYELEWYVPKHDNWYEYHADVERLMNSGSYIFSVDEQQSDERFAKLTIRADETQFAKELLDLAKKIEPFFGIYNFSIRTAPYVSRTHNGKNTKVPIVLNEELYEWFERQANRHGFNIIHAHPKPFFVRKLTKFSGETFHINEVEFYGRLSPVYNEKFYRCFVEGIGRKKGFGYGTLMLK